MAGRSVDVVVTVETRYNECSWDHENSYVITIFSLYALGIALFQRVGTKNRVRYIYKFRYMHVRYSEFRLYMYIMLIRLCKHKLWRLSTIVLLNVRVLWTVEEYTRIVLV